MLLPLALCTFAQIQEPTVRVLARGEDGFGIAAGFSTADPEPWLAPIPFLTRSEVVQRVVPRADGIALRVEGVQDEGAVEVFALAHATDHQVLIIDGSAVLVGPGRLPVWIRGLTRADGLTQAARQDGVALAAERMDCVRPPDLPNDYRLLAIATEAPRTAWYGNDEEVCGELVDQVFWARSQPITDFVSVERRNAAWEEGVLELTLANPAEIEQGKTWTLVVRIDRARSRPVPVATEAAARRSPEGFLKDRAVELGIDHVHLEGPDEQLDIRPTMGPGVAWGDVDLDGLVDLYLVQGAGRAGSSPIPNRLLRQFGGCFEDVTWFSGGGDTGAGMGALFFDGEGDGDLDLYVANYGADVLYDNQFPHVHVGGVKAPTSEAMDPFWERTLIDRSAEAGVGGDLWSAGIAASDYDHDGDIDLYVTSYLVYDTSLMPPAEEVAYRREDPIEMLPFAFPGQRNTFLRNESGPLGLRFVDATKELKLEDEAGRGMQPVFWDFDRDRDDDLYIANDVSYNALWRNEADGRFKNVSFSSGLDDPRGGMGLAIGDVDLDGDEDLFLTNWQLEANALYLNNLLSHKSQKHRVATFRDAVVQAGLGTYGIGVTSWGAELFDAENDGDLDLFVANGYTSPDYESTGICVGQPNHFFENTGEGKFIEASAKAGSALARKLPSRSAVGCDFDQDGDVDIVVTANNGPVQLLRNELPASAKGHWLLVRLRGDGANTYAIGAEVTISAGGRLFRRSLRAGTSYLGGNPPELHFGLGDADSIDELSVRWPSGAESTHAIDGVDRVIELHK